MGETLVALGRSYEEENKLEEAKKAYQDCLNIIPHHEEAQNSLDFLMKSKTQKQLIEPGELMLPGTSLCFLFFQCMYLLNVFFLFYFPALNIKSSHDSSSKLTDKKDDHKKDKKSKKKKSKGNKKERKSSSSSSASETSDSSDSSTESSSSSESSSSTGNYLPFTFFDFSFILGFLIFWCQFS